MADKIAAQMQPFAVELVTAIRHEQTPAKRAAVVADFVQKTFLPAIPAADQGWAIVALIGCLAYDFAGLLDAVPGAQEQLQAYALALASQTSTEGP